MSDVSNVMPKFDFSKATLKSSAELTPTKKVDNGKFLRPGRHEVTITSVENYGLDKNDSNWLNFRVIYTGTGGKTISDFVKVPMRDNVYGAKKSVGPFKRLASMIRAMGVELTIENAGSVLPKLFEKTDGLIGTALVVEAGYENAYDRYIKNTDGTSHIEVVLQDGTTLNDLATGAALKFPDSKAAAEHCKGANIRFDSFTRVLAYDVSSTPSKKSANSNW
jgi:hypothetical protein